MFGTRTDYMRSFNVYLSGIPPFRAVCRFSVQQHVRSRATCLFNAAGTDHWCGAIGDTLPLIPPGVLEHEAKALACLHRQKGGVRTEARGPSGAALETEASGPSGAAYQAGNASSIKRQASGAPEDGISAKRRKPPRIKLGIGTVVWDRNPDLLPPVAWMIVNHTRVSGRSGGGGGDIILELERIPVGPPGERRAAELLRVIDGTTKQLAQRRISEMAAFSELVREIWHQRRAQLPLDGRMEIEAAVCSALLQNWRNAPHITLEQMWAPFGEGEACPVQQS